MYETHMALWKVHADKSSLPVALHQARACVHTKSVEEAALSS